MRSCACRIFAAALAAGLLGTGGAHAQTSGSEVVMAAGTPVPTRFINGQVVSPRAQNLTPLGVNYSDCVQDMVLQFSVSISGFDGSETMKIWATRNGDCAADTTRGVGAATATCWIVNDGITGKPIQLAQTFQFNVRVQDLVGPQNAPPFPPTLVTENSTACSQQPSFAAVPMTIWFVPTNSGGNAVGMPYSYQIPTDLVGPPPPAVSTPGIGDTLLLVNWTANTDSDTAGYDVFVDPRPGSPVAVQQLICPDGSAGDGAVGDAAGGGEAGLDGSSEASAASPGYSGCYYSAGNGNPTSNGGCSSTALMGGSVQEGGTSTPVYDDAGNLIDSGSTGGGGLATIPCQYLVGTSCPSGSPAYTAQNASVPGATSTNFTVTDLTNGALYNVAVSAVDSSGNVGPPSTLTCQTPQPVEDFWKAYRQAGGQAGGGFCDVTLPGGPAGTAAAFGGVAACAALLRRRRRGR